MHGLAPRVVVNRQYESGQFSSLLTGLRAIDRPGVQALLLTLVDVPLVSAATVRAVIDGYRATHAPIVRPVNPADSSRHGHPVLIDRRLFDSLRAADPAAGAKPIVRSYASRAGDIPIDDEGAFLDIDTPEDYERVTRGSPG
jgi:molybdenum cofactor cytidylyltransferase